MSKTTNPNTDSIIYQGPDGAIELKGDYDKETIWGSLDQISTIFGRDKSVISRHIKNIFNEGELVRDSVVAINAITASDGKTYQVDFYNLDVIISVGYRVNSNLATKFRQWATQILKQHITQGYTINKKLLQNNYEMFQKALVSIQKLSNNQLSSDDIIELVKAFSSTWFSLDAFDKDSLALGTQTKSSIKLEASKLLQDIGTLKQDLLAKKQATDLFATEKHPGNLEAIWGNIFQSAFGEEVYSSVESKSSHLLYFIIKNHPFNDGNKRTGAFAFIWFLQKSGYEYRSKITPEALTAVTLLIATSDPREKQKMTDLVMFLLGGAK